MESRFPNGDEDIDQDGGEDRDQDGDEDRDQDGDEELVVPSLASESSFTFLLSDRVLHFCFRVEFSIFAFGTSFGFLLSE